MTKWSNHVVDMLVNRETEQRILEAAKKEFEKRYSGVCMQEISDVVGISKASLHYYFRSKDNCKLLYCWCKYPFSQTVAFRGGHIYQKPVKKLREFGPLKIEPKKTSIHIGNRFGFAGIYTRKDYINLEIHLKRKLSPRIINVEQASANRYHHTIKLTALADIV